MSSDEVTQAIEEAIGEKFDPHFTTSGKGITVRGALAYRTGSWSKVRRALEKLGLDKKGRGMYVGMGHVVMLEYLKGGAVKITDSTEGGTMKLSYAKPKPETKPKPKGEDSNPLLDDAEARVESGTVGSLNSANVRVRPKPQPGFFTPNTDRSVLQR